MEYEQITDITEIAGKTIVKVEFLYSVNALVLVFTDKTYVCVEAEPDYDGCAEIITSNTRCFSVEDQVSLGFITEEEKRRIEFEQEAERQRLQNLQKIEREQLEQATYEMLKQKYEGK